MENESKQLFELPGPIPVKPETSAEFRTVPNDAEEFGKVTQVTERKVNHTLTVRETARMFEAAGVARTERSIINWCQPNRQGITRLDSYFDPNERKYFITPQSVDAVIQEEIQRAKKSGETSASEPIGNHVEPVKHTRNSTSSTDDRKLQDLELEILDLKITNRAKDMFIEQLKIERSDLFERFLPPNQTFGERKINLHQLDKN